MIWSRRIRAAALLVLAFACAEARSEERAHDGHWWRERSSELHQGYLSGFVDCAIYDAGARGLELMNTYEVEPDITKYYESNPAVRSRPLSIVMFEVAERLPRVKRLEGGEHYPEKHGFFDGVYWSTAEPEHRLGFVEGYLDCWRVRRLKGATFSKGAAWYVAKVSEWFGVTDDGKPMRLERSGGKIADVIHRLMD